MATTARRRKLRVTAKYIKWFVEHQSGDRVLARRLAEQFESGWRLMRRLLRQGLPGREVVDRLQGAGYSAALLRPGYHEQQLPGRTASFLVMDRENGAGQMVYERWRSISDEPTNAVLIGLGRRDVGNHIGSEKQLHLAAFELPKRGDYVEISTQSFSPLGKVVVVFVAVTLLSGCEPQTPAPVPAPAPPPPPPPPPPRTKVKRSGNSDHGYAVAGGRPYPLGHNGPAQMNTPEGPVILYVHPIEVSFPVGTEACPNHLKQSMRDTVTYGNGTSERHPAPTPGDPGGHESLSSWAPDPPPDGANPKTQSNPDGTKSYIDAPGLGITHPSQLPAKKRTTYRWELIDCNGTVLDCQQAEYTLDIDANGAATLSFAPPTNCP